MLRADVPDAVLAPMCSGSFTDSRWVREAFPDCVAYGFAPFVAESFHAMDGGRDHEPDERILVEDVTYQALFFERLARDLLVVTPFPAHDEAAVRDRFRGALLGLAVGEALGAPAEFLTAEQIEERFGVITEMIGGGCHDVAPGETTDATEMMLCLAREPGGRRRLRPRGHHAPLRRLVREPARAT